MTDYIPTAQEIEPYALDILEGRVDEVSQKLSTTSERIQRLLKTDPDAMEMIRAAQDEFVALLRLRALLLMPQALETVELAMVGGLEGKKAMAAVRAAETVMDRTVMPKIARAPTPSTEAEVTKALPELSELLKGVDDPNEAEAITDKYLATMEDLKALRKGRVIDGG